MSRVWRVVSLVGAVALGVISPSYAGTIGTVADNGCLTSSTGAIFCDADIRPTGTGVFDPFLRVQRDNGSKDGTPSTYSSGYNTDASITDPANDGDDPWTKALLASELGFVEIDGAQYLLFTVDINQQGKPEDSSSLLDLVNFELFNCSTATYQFFGDPAANGCVQFFDGFSADEWVTFNYRNHEGSGSGDIDVYVPVPANYGSFSYIALRDGWGTPPGTNSDNDGFQEWAAHIGTPADSTDDIDFVDRQDDIDSVPEPTMLVLLGAGLAAAARRRQRQGQA